MKLPKYTKRDLTGVFILCSCCLLHCPQIFYLIRVLGITHQVFKQSLMHANPDVAVLSQSKTMSKTPDMTPYPIREYSMLSGCIIQSQVKFEHREQNISCVLYFFVQVIVP